VALIGVIAYLVGFVYGLMLELPVGRTPRAEGVLFRRTVDFDDPMELLTSGVLMFLL
jgi:hypothetical protein